MGEFERDRWKVIAFLGRYGHQPVEQLLKLTAREIGMLSDSVAQILRDEADAMRKANGG